MGAHQDEDSAPPAPPVAEPPAAPTSRPAQQPVVGSRGSGDGDGGTEPEPPPEFIDPISEEIMRDPVMLLETGQTYERASIQRWLATCAPGPCRDPLTGTELKSTEFVPNYALKGLIANWAERHRIGDLHTFSMQHSDNLKRLASAMGRVQLSPRRGATAGSPSGSAGGSPLRPRPAADVNASAVAAGPGAATPCGRRAFSDGAEGYQAAAAVATLPQGSSGASGARATSPSPAYPSVFGAPPPRPASNHPGDSTESQPEDPPPWQHAAGVAAAGGAGGGGGRGMYPSPERPMRTTEDKLQDLAKSLEALQPGQLVSGGKGAAAYHAWTLMQLAKEPECKDRMLQSQVIPLAVYLLGQPDLEDAKPSLAGLLQRLAVTSPAVATEILTAGGVHALALMVGSEERKWRVAASTALYFMGWLAEQIKWSATVSLAQQAVQQQLPPNPLYALWRSWEVEPPRPAPQQLPPPPLPPPPPQQLGGEEGARVALAPAPPPFVMQSVPTPQAPHEDQEEWEALAFITHMLTNAPATPPPGTPPPPPLDVRATGLPQVLAHVASSGASSEAAQYAALVSLHALARVPQNRGVLLGPLIERLGGADWDVAGRAAGVLWELAYEEAAGNSFLVLQALSSSPQFLPALSFALACPAPALRKAATGLLGCVLFDGTGLASSAGSGAAVDSQRYVMTDGWRQALLAPGSPTVQVLLESAQNTIADPQLAQLALSALANLAAARGTAAAGPIAVPHGKPSAFDKLSAKLQEKLHGKAERQGGEAEHKQVAPGPRGAILSHEGAVPALLQLVLNPSRDGLEPLGGGGGSGAFGSGSFTSISPPDTPCSAGSQASAASFSFTPIGQLSGGGPGAADTQGMARLVLPPTLLALCNLVTEPAGRERVRGWAKAYGRMGQLQAALTAAMSNRQLAPHTQEQARRLLHELSLVPGPLQRAVACRAVPPPPRPPAYPTP